MAQDVWSALINGYLAFAHTRAGDLAETSASDGVALVGSLVPGAGEGKTTDLLKKLKQDLSDAGDAFKPLLAAIQADLDALKDSVKRMGDEIDKSPFTWENAAAAATHLGYVLASLDAALGKVAKEATKNEPEDVRGLLERDIRNISEPWKAPFRRMGADAGRSFDAFCKQVLGLDNAAGQLGDRLTWDRDELRMAVTLTGVGPVGLGPAQAGGASLLSMDGTWLEAFFSYKDRAKLGFALRTRMRAGLRGDKMLERIIPAQGATTETNTVAINLDTRDGLTFGDGPNRKITLPARFNVPGVELRELAIALPPTRDAGSGRIDLMITVAGKLGDTFGVVAEGGGLLMRWKGTDGEAVEVLPKPPSAAGLRIRSGLLNGGGFLQYDEPRGEYGGLLDLQFGKFGITAFGLFDPDPFSLVVVMGVVFRPRIELSFGFTLNGLGGIVAAHRRLSAAGLKKALQEGGLDQLLFPSDPVMAAPQILERLREVFPQETGHFVVGPIALLGWGSQAGFVKAKLGVVLSLPEPTISVLGVLSLVVPTPETPRELRTIDFHLEVAAVLAQEHFLVFGSLRASKLAQVTVTGDMGMLVRWGASAEMAMSAGGFYPKYLAPPELLNMRRLALDFSPPIKVLKVQAEAYFALTSNTLQFGGMLRVIAEVGPVTGKAWLAVDALFRWAPHLHFVFDVDAGIEIQVFGKTFCGVTFRGHLSGMTPWRIEGRAAVTIFFKEIPFNLGPWEWGTPAPAAAIAISPVAEVAAALRAAGAWKPLLPAGADSLVRLTEDDNALLVHPLGQLELKQLRVPLETSIDRIGSHPVTTRRVHLETPRMGSLTAQRFSHAHDRFAPNHFLSLSEDEQISRPSFEPYPCGLRMAPADGLAHGPAVSVTTAWETHYPHDSFGRFGGEAVRLAPLAAHVLSLASVARAARTRGNPYAPAVPASGPPAWQPRDEALVQVSRRDDLTQVAGLDGLMTVSDALERMAALDTDARTFQRVDAGAFA